MHAWAKYAMIGIEMCFPSPEAGVGRHIFLVGFPPLRRERNGRNQVLPPGLARPPDACCIGTKES